MQRFECKDCDKKWHYSLKTQPILEKQSYLDIESSDLNAEFGMILSWSILHRDHELVFDALRRRSLNEEKRLLKTLLSSLADVDTVVTYYGTGFDIPMIRSRCLYHGLQFPEYMGLHHIDLYYVARAKLQLKSNRLARVSQFLRVGAKTNVEPEIWAKAMLGSSKEFRDAIGWILEHNKEDVRVLEKVHKALEPFMTGRRASV